MDSQLSDLRVKMSWEVPSELTITELEPWEVREPAGYDKGTEMDWMNSRRPFVYHPGDHQVVVGPPGTFHSQIDPNQHGINGGVFDETWRHGAGIDSLGYAVPKEVLEQLSHYFKVPIVDHDAYHFGGAQNLLNGEFPVQNFGTKESYPAKPWQKGQWGKALEYNGKAYLWSPNNNDQMGGGSPHHDEVVGGIYKGDPIYDPAVKEIYEKSNKFDISPEGQVTSSFHNDHGSDEFLANLHPDLWTGENWAFESKIGAGSDDWATNWDKSRPIPPKLYHYTVKRNRDSIAQHGLLTRRPSGYSEAEQIGDPAGVYLVHEPDGDPTFDPMDWYEVNTQGLNIEPHGPHAYYSPDSIPAQNIRLIGSQRPYKPRRGDSGPDMWNALREAFGASDRFKIEHQLNWKPGYKGKGLIFGNDYSDKEVHTWPINLENDYGDDGDPTHSKYLLDNYGRANMVYDPFYIGEDGSVAFAHGHADQRSELYQIDPRLRPRKRYEFS